MTGDAPRVRAAILGQALRGQSVTVPSLAGATALQPEVVESALAALHKIGTIYLRDGAVVAAYPLSLVPTTHWVKIGDVTVYANCAIDALAVPVLAGQESRLGSTCGLCRAPVTITMNGDRILESRPAAPVVFYVAKDCCASGPAVLTRCPHIHFFCGRDHAAHWREAHPEYRGTVFDLANAVAFATEHFAEAIRAVKGHAPRHRPAPRDILAG